MRVLLICLTLGAQPRKWLRAKVDLTTHDRGGRMRQIIIGNREGLVHIFG
jgi:hypothetical protein